jgi:hypothetical protein
MIRRLKAGGYRLYSRKVNPKTGKRRNLGTFSTLAGAKKHERGCSLQAPLAHALSFAFLKVAA